MHHNVIFVIQGNVLIPRPRLLVHCEVSEPGKLLLSLCKANEHLRMHSNKTLQFSSICISHGSELCPVSSLIILNLSA